MIKQILCNSLIVDNRTFVSHIVSNYFESSLFLLIHVALPFFVFQYF